MKKSLWLLLLLLTGCAQSEPTMSGYITAIERDVIVVTDGYGKAMSFYEAEQQLKVGMYVDVWGTEIEDGELQRAAIEHIRVRNSKAREGAVLTEQEAMAEALSRTNIAVPVLHVIRFEEGVWYFKFIDAASAKRFQLHIHDF